MRKLFINLITNNTGISTKNFAVVFGVIIASFTIINVIILIWVDSFSKITIKSESINALSILVTSVEGVVAVLMGLKIYGEKNEVKKNNVTNEPNNNNNEISG